MTILTGRRLPARIAALVLFAGLAACGVKGDLEPPPDDKDARYGTPAVSAALG